MPATVCLITPGHIASTPRLVKEAESLVGAGYRVHVVAGRHYPPADSLDATLLAGAGWACTRVDYRTGAGAFYRKALRKICRGLVTALDGLSGIKLAALAHHAESLHLASVASRIPADLYVGHCLGGLPAAALAAKKRGARYGFDLEDFHETETTAALNDPAERTSARLLCSWLIPGCAHLTAASPLIAAACAQAYGVTPLTTLNAFPLSESPTTPFVPVPPSSKNPLRFYWFSQTIGEGRGLEAVIDSLALMKTPAELRLRGQASARYRAALEKRAGATGLRAPLVFLPSAPPSDMVRLSADAHIGLSVEAPTPPNRDICLTNKIFTYLLAGVPVALTPTRAQTALAAQLGEAALVLDFANDPAGCARSLDAFAASPERQASARNHAWKLGRERFNWDREQQIFLRSIAAALSPESITCPK